MIRWYHQAPPVIGGRWYYTVGLDRMGAARIRSRHRTGVAAVRAADRDMQASGVMWEPATYRPLRAGDIAPESLRSWTQTTTFK